MRRAAAEEGYTARSPPESTTWPERKASAAGSSEDTRRRKKLGGGGELESSSWRRRWMWGKRRGGPRGVGFYRGERGRRRPTAREKGGGGSGWRLGIDLTGGFHMSAAGEATAHRPEGKAEGRREQRGARRCSRQAGPTCRRVREGRRGADREAPRR